MPDVANKGEVPSAVSGSIGMNGTARPVIGHADSPVLAVHSLVVIAVRVVGQRVSLACDNLARHMGRPPRLIPDERA